MTKAELVKTLKSLQPPRSAGSNLSLLQPTRTTEELETLLDELRVHQDELEMQNQELWEMRQMLQDSRSRYADLYDFAPVGYITFDAKGCIQEINLTGATMLGIERSRLIGKPFISCVVKKDHKKFLGHLRRCIQTHRNVATELGMAVSTGGSIQVQLLSVPVPDTELPTTRYRTAITDITERKRAEEEITRRNRELAALNAVTAAVSSSLELPEVLATLKNLLADQLEVPGGAIFFYEGASDRLHLQAGWGLPPTMLCKCKSLPARGFYNERVIRDKETVLRPDWREITSFLSIGLGDASPQWQSYLCVPILANHEIQGVIDLFSQTPTVFSQDQVDFFKAVGQQVGVAIQNARLFEQVSIGRRRLEALSHRLVEVQEAQRRHIARELHDEIGQLLTGLKLTLEMKARLPSKLLMASLHEEQELINELIARVRELSLDLRPAMLDDLGLLGTLLWHFERYTTQTLVKVRFEHIGLEGRFPPEVETATYRIVQEALTNVARHANVGEVRVRLWANSEVLSVQIEDQGTGFDPEVALSAEASSGLSGMQERAFLLGGHLSIESAYGAGTHLTAVLPISKPVEKRRRKDDYDNHSAGR